MRQAFLPSRLDGPTGDPGLFVEVTETGRSLLFDAGNLDRLSPRRLMKIERAVVTHTHMDHFAGFDRLLRQCLGRERPLTVTGPPGFLERIGHRLAAYEWNLVEGYPIRVVAEEIDGDRMRTVVFRGAGGMRPEPVEERLFDGVVHAERALVLRAAILDHGIPVLATLLQEPVNLAVDKDRLRRLGYVPGPWLDELKQGIRRGRSDSKVVRVLRGDGSSVSRPLGELRRAVLDVRPGRSLAYVTDLAWRPANVERVVALAREATLMVCEAAFLDEDRELAAERGHLTARQAGELARAAGARQLALHHLSPRYAGRVAEVEAEAAAAFGEPLTEVPLISGDARTDLRE